MARKINNDHVFTIAQFLSESKASETLGQPVAAIVEATGINEHAIRRILKKPEFGFSQSRRLTSSGAVTYYHDWAKMNAANLVSEFEVIDYSTFADKEKLTAVINYLNNAVAILDPTHKMSKYVADAEAKEKTNREKNFFHWLMLFAGKEDELERLTERIKAKVALPIIKRYGAPESAENPEKFVVEQWKDLPEINKLIFALGVLVNYDLDALQ